MKRNMKKTIQRECITEYDKPIYDPEMQIRESKLVCFFGLGNSMRKTKYPLPGRAG